MTDQEMNGTIEGTNEEGILKSWVPPVYERIELKDALSSTYYLGYDDGMSSYMS